MSQSLPSSSTLTSGCLACGGPASIRVNYQLCDVLLCKYCVLAGGIKAREVTRPDGMSESDLFFAIGDFEITVQTGLRGPVEFASAGLDGMEYFEALKDHVFEVTQSISD